MARGALRDARVSAADVAAIGITNQRETTILWERATGKPVANAIVWQDRRTAALCDELRARGVGETRRRAHRACARPVLLRRRRSRWLLDNVDGLRARAEAGEIAFGTVDSWLIWNLTGGRRHVTDVTNASRTLLFDIHRWPGATSCSPRCASRARCCPRCCRAARTSARRRSSCSAAPIPIAGVAGDQQAALFGQACFAPGVAKNTYGTGSFILLNTGDRAVRSEHGLLTTVAYRARARRAPCTRSKARSSSPARRCSGCATGSG